VTLLEWRHLVQGALSKAGLVNPALEAKWLIAGALGRDNSFATLHPTYAPSPEEEGVIQEWLSRRLKGEPLSRLKGVREFWSLPFHLNEHTLDPRPETERLVEGVLNWVGTRTRDSWRILDLGTGSGCLLITLLHELKKATGVGIDLSGAALEMAQTNAILNGVETRATFQQGNWGEGQLGSFDIIVSNPPYIPLQEKDTLAQDVLLFDPSLALFGGTDGLECYRHLVNDMKRLLSPGGVAVLEIGYGQRDEVEALLSSAGFYPLFVLKDLAGIDRIIGVRSVPPGVEALP
jgi:release factor glutamine methyltransferase